MIQNKLILTRNLLWISLAFFSCSTEEKPLVIGNESAMNPKAINLVNRKAVGLLQFMPMTMKFLGTSREALLKMSNVEQLEYVQQFFQAEKLDYESYEDLYLYAFYPEALRKKLPDSYQFSKIVYEQNKIFDINQDGKLVLGEFRTFIRNQVPIEYRYVLIPKWQKTFEISFVLLVFPCLLLLQIDTFNFRVFKHSK